MRAQLIYEKFEQESDPIKDLGVGGVIFSDEFEERYKKPERELYLKWYEFMYQFVDKWICGEFNHYPKRKYNPERKYAEVLFQKLTMDRDGILNLETTSNGTYCIIEGEKYTIKEK
jgi:hypothetical protein